MTKKIKRIFRKIFLSILSLLGLTSLVSCYPFIMTPIMYGMPANYHQITGTVRGKDVDGDGVGDPVPGIQYSYEGQNLETVYDEDGNIIEHKIPVTDENGIFYVDYWDSNGAKGIFVNFIDIDGEENGLYQENQVFFEFSEENKSVMQDVELKEQK